MHESNYFREERYYIPEHWIIDRDLSSFGIEYLEFLDILINTINKQMKENDFDKVIDVGCGDGRIAYEMTRLGLSITGVDYSKRALNFASYFVPNAKFLEMDLTKLNEENHWDDKFDMALMINVIEHINSEYHLNLLRFIRKVLKKDGVFIISVPTKKRPIDKKTHFMHFEEDEIKMLLKEADFLPERIIYFHKHPKFHYIISRILENPIWKLRIGIKFYRYIYKKKLKYADNSSAGMLMIISKR